MNNHYPHWRICDVCGYECNCREADQSDVEKYGNVDDICQSCSTPTDAEQSLELQKVKSLLIKIRDSGDWFYSTLAMNQDVDGFELLKEIEAVVGVK